MNAKSLLKKALWKITPKRSIFTPQNKMKADGQMISRGVVNLLQPNLNNQTLRTTSKEDVKRTHLTKRDSYTSRKYGVDKNTNGKYIWDRKKF